MTDHRYHFASDNSAGICPEAWQTLEQANQGFAAGYGSDDWTHRAIALVRELFETDCEVFFTFNGTAANSLTLAHLCRPFHAVLCHEMAHVETDECGAPEFFSGGSKIRPIAGEAGRVTPDGIMAKFGERRDVHFPKTTALSITQSTEVGTVYQLEHLAALAELKSKLNLYLHMDGARFANAVASLNCAPKEITWQVGVDVLSFGGTKNGLPIGDAVVFFNRELAAEFNYRTKQAAQLGSKMRFLTAPWVGLLESGAWLRNAQHANRCAKLLESELRKIPGLTFLSSVEANAVFVELPPAVTEKLHAQGWHFYNFITATGVRFMCSWQTQEADIMALANDVSAAIGTA